MFEILAILVVIVVAYLYFNNRKNSDPHNRKCAAEICEYLATGDAEADHIVEIFMENARYRKQALHIVSMVPPLLINAGYPRDAALATVPLLRAAAEIVPE